MSNNIKPISVIEKTNCKEYYNQLIQCLKETENKQIVNSTCRIMIEELGKCIHNNKEMLYQKNAESNTY